MKTYKRGDAAAYGIWLEHQTPEVAATAARFRPWEVYKWQGRDIYGYVVDFESNGQFVTFEREDGVRFIVTPDQIDLYSNGSEFLPEDRLYQAAKVA